MSSKDPFEDRADRGLGERVSDRRRGSVDHRGGHRGVQARSGARTVASGGLRAKGAGTCGAADFEAGPRRGNCRRPGMEGSGAPRTRDGGPLRRRLAGGRGRAGRWFRSCRVRFRAAAGPGSAGPCSARPGHRAASRGARPSGRGTAAGRRSGRDGGPWTGGLRARADARAGHGSRGNGPRAGGDGVRAGGSSRAGPGATVGRRGDARRSDRSRGVGSRSDGPRVTGGLARNSSRGAGLRSADGVRADGFRSGNGDCGASDAASAGRPDLNRARAKGRRRTARSVAGTEGSRSYRARWLVDPVDEKAATRPADPAEEKTASLPAEPLQERAASPTEPVEGKASAPADPVEASVAPDPDPSAAPPTSELSTASIGPAAGGEIADFARSRSPALRSGLSAPLPPRRANRRSGVREMKGVREWGRGECGVR